MEIFEIPLAEKLAETAHWSDDPPVRMEEQEFDLLAFELWRLGSRADLTGREEGPDERCTVASRASCL